MSHPKIKKLDTPQIVNKGWGHELVLFNNEELCGKILCFNKGAKFSLHAHKLKFELFYCLQGSIKVTGVNTEDASKFTIEINEGEVLEIPRGAFHQIEAITEAKIVEFSTNHQDTDSYRIEPGDSQKVHEYKFAI